MRIKARQKPPPTFVLLSDFAAKGGEIRRGGSLGIGAVLLADDLLGPARQAGRGRRLSKTVEVLRFGAEK
jgi:hypothetical protein